MYFYIADNDLDFKKGNVILVLIDMHSLVGQIATDNWYFALAAGHLDDLHLWKYRLTLCKICHKGQATLWELS